MNEEMIRKEGVDVRLVLLLLLKKGITILVCTLLGVAAAGIIYMSIYMAAVGGAKYKCEAKFYIHFDNFDDKDYFDYYYNGYCWDELLSSDMILGYAMENCSEKYGLSQSDREFVDDCITADIQSDVRVLTIYIETPTEIDGLNIRQTIIDAIAHFQTVGEHIENIELIQQTDPKLEMIDNNIWRALVLGGVLGFVFAIIGVLIVNAYNRDIYLPSEFEKRFGIVCAGILLRGEKEEDLMEFLDGKGLDEKDDPMGFHRELRDNLDYLMQSGNVNAVSVSELAASEDVIYKKLRPLDGIVLLFPQKKRNGMTLERIMHTLRVQQVKVLAGVMTDADGAFIRTYFFGKK